MTEETEQPAKLRVALLDENDVYCGMVDVDADQLTDRHLPEVTVCDLPQNSYRWNGSSFVPLPQRTRGEIPAEPLRAIALALYAIHAAGTPLPNETLQWLSEYPQSFDAGNV